MNPEWESTTLGECCQIKPPKRLARSRLAADDAVSFVPMSDLGIREKWLKATEEKSLGEVAGSYTYFADGDVLLAKITPCFENGKLSIANDLANGVGFGSSEFVVFRPRRKLNPEYLFYFLSQDSFRGEGARLMSGAVGHKRVPKEFVEQYPIALPPFPEQERIVAILDQAFAGMDKAIANTEKNLANTRELFESQLNAIFSHPRDDWTVRKLGELCAIKHGYAFKSQYFEKAGEYVVLTPGSFYEGGGFRDQGEKTKYYVGEIPKDYVLARDDFLLAMTEQAAGLLGSSLIVPESDRYLHNQRLGLVQPFGDAVWHNRFFFHQFNTKNFRRAVQATASGIKVRHTSPKKLGVIEVAFPRFATQQARVAERLDELGGHSEQLKSHYRQKLAALTELKQSLLQKAFAGELTADDANEAKAVAS